MTVGTKMKLTVEQVKKFLKDHIKGEIRNVAPLSGGEWSQAFAYEYLEDDYVVRFGQHKDDYIKDKFASSYASNKLPIPKVLEIGTAFNGYYAISERAYGTMIDDHDKAAMRKTIPSLFATMDAIRETDISQRNGYGMWDVNCQGEHTSWHEFLIDVAYDRPDRKIYGWKDNLKDSPVGDKPFNTAYASLMVLAKGLPEARSLIHNDLLNFNVLVNDHQITAVIDWGNAMYGDFLYDLAQFTFWGPLHEPVKGVDWEAEALAHYKAIGLDIPMFKERLQCCMIHIGLDAQKYRAYKQDWEIFELVAKRTLEIAESKIIKDLTNYRCKLR
ncbi:phosphotransferase [Candidatus Saccharibacteria bacterium]|nr:phosphotransferase [Candidatus Saccharibacteria bacterium]